MKLNLGMGLIQRWSRLGPRWLPFADAATAELPLPRLLRLSLFQVTVGMATGLMVGTLNRVLIVELHVAAWLVALMVALPLVFSPFRALLGFRSDTHRSALGWKRVPFVWMGSGLQFAGLSIMPFALLLLSGDHNGPAWLGHVAAALAFVLVGSGMQIVQTAGLALAADLAPDRVRPRVVALMYTMLLLGMIGFGAVFSVLLADFSPRRLIEVVRGSKRCGARSRAPSAWRRARASLKPGSALRNRAARCVSWWQWAWAPRPSTCRTSSWSPTAPRCCTSPWAPPRCSPR